MSTRISGVAVSTEERPGAASSAAGLQEQVLSLRTGEASSRELVEAALERAEAAQSTLNAFRIIRAEEALAEALRAANAAEAALDT